MPPTLRLLAAFAASVVMVASAVGARELSARDRRSPAATDAGPRPGTTKSSSGRPGEVPVAQIALPAGIGCANPYVVSAASVPTTNTGLVARGDEAFLKGVRNWLGGEIEPLVPLRGTQLDRVALTATDQILVHSLIANQAFVGAGGEPSFGRALVPVSTAGNVVNEAVAIPFPSPADAARFDNTYISTSCANQFRLDLVTPGGEALVGSPAVTPANTAGLAIALRDPVYGHPDAIMAHAVVGDWLFLIVAYTNLQILGSGDAGVSEAMAAGLAAIGIGYRLNP